MTNRAWERNKMVQFIRRWREKLQMGGGGGLSTCIKEIWNNRCYIGRCDDTVISWKQSVSLHWRPLAFNGISFCQLFLLRIQIIFIHQLTIIHFFLSSCSTVVSVWILGYIYKFTLSPVPCVYVPSPKNIS